MSVERGSTSLPRSQGDAGTGSRAAACAALICIQAGMLGLFGLALWALAEGRRRRFAARFFHEQFALHAFVWGGILIAFAVWLGALGVSVWQRRTWTYPAVLATEAVLAVVSIVRVHPLRSVVGVALAVAVVVLAVTSRVAPGGSGDGV